MAAFDYNNFSRPGQINDGADTKEMFLELFSGEVLASFDRTTIMQGKVRERTISGGKAAVFPVIGRAAAGYHLPGMEIDPGKIKNAERVINIDALMYSSTFVDNWEDMVSHYEVRSQYASELGAVLGYSYDKHILQEIILAAREGAPTIDDPDQRGGTVIRSDKFAIDPTSGAADVAEQAAALAEAIYQTQAIFDEAWVPEGQERWCVLRPEEYYVLVKAVQDNGFSVINRDYDGAGSYAEGTVLKVGGVNIIKSPNLPKEDLSTITDPTDINFYHRGNFTQTVGTVFTADAVGAVRLMGIGIETDYQVHRQGTFIIARQSVGIGALRPECAVELSLDTIPVP
jgi:hypothetical protein